MKAQLPILLLETLGNTSKPAVCSIGTLWYCDVFKIWQHTIIQHLCLRVIFFIQIYKKQGANDFIWVYITFPTRPLSWHFQACGEKKGYEEICIRTQLQIVH